MGIPEEAAALAEELHRGQKRKGKDKSYFEAHLAPVAELVREAGGTDVQIAAAYLHDAVEDQGGLPTLERIRSEFGDEVADMVKDLSDSIVDTSKADSVKAPWAVRKKEYLERLHEKPTASLEVSVADKLNNASAILDDYEEQGDALWTLFKAKHSEYHLWYYESLVSVFRSTLPDHPLVDRLDRVVALLRRASSP